MLILVTISLALLSLTLNCAPLKRPDAKLNKPENDAFVMIDKEGHEFFVNRTPSPGKQVHSLPPSVPFEADYSLLMQSVARENNYKKPSSDSESENMPGNDLTPNSCLHFYISSLTSGNLEESRILGDTLDQSISLFSSSDCPLEQDGVREDDKEVTTEIKDEKVETEQLQSSPNDSEINFEQLEKSLIGYVPTAEAVFYETATAVEVQAEKPASVQPELRQVNEPTWSLPGGTSTTTIAIGFLAIFAAYATLRNNK